MRGIKHTQLREMLAYKFPVRIAIDILQNIGRYNFGKQRISALKERGVGVWRDVNSTLVSACVFEAGA